MANYRDLANVIVKDFSDVILRYSFVESESGRIRKLRFELINFAFIDIFYEDSSGKYTFHYESENEFYRHDNAPHHPEVRTYPRHLHNNELIEESHLSDDILKAVVQFFEIIKEKHIK